MLIRNFLIPFLFFFIPFFSFAQNSNSSWKEKNFVIESKFQKGFLLPHYSSFRYYPEKYINSYEINFGIKTSGEKLWQNLYKNPILGLGFFYSDFGNKEILGNSKSVFGFFNTSLYSSHFVDFNFNFSLGLAYLNKKFDSIENYYNLVIGSNINAYVNICLEPRIKIKNKYQIITGLAFTHFSNGAVKMPNRGINVVSFRIGAGYLVNNNFYNDLEENKNEKYKKYFDFFANYSFGIKRTYPVSKSEPYVISVVTFDFGINTNYKSRLALGIDMINNPSKVVYFENYEEKKFSFPDFLSTGIHFAYDLKISNVSFTGQQGYYFYTKLKTEAKLYNRWGFKLKATENIFFNLFLNTYFFKAQWIEWGGGFYF